MKKIIVLILILAVSAGVFASEWNFHLQESALNTGFGFTYETDKMEYSLDAGTGALNLSIFMDEDAYSADTIGNRMLYAMMAYNQCSVQALYKAYGYKGFELDAGLNFDVVYFNGTHISIPYNATQLNLNGAVKAEFNFAKRLSVFASTKIPFIGLDISRNHDVGLTGIFTDRKIFEDIAYNTSVGLSIRFGFSK